MSDVPFTLDSLKEAMHQMLAIQQKYRQSVDASLSKMRPCPACWKSVKLSEDGNAIEMCDTYYQALLRDPRVERVANRASLTSEFLGLKLSLTPCVPNSHVFDIAIGAADCWMPPAP